MKIEAMAESERELGEINAGALGEAEGVVVPEIARLALLMIAFSQLNSR